MPEQQYAASRREQEHRQEDGVDPLHLLERLHVRRDGHAEACAPDRDEHHGGKREECRQREVECEHLHDGNAAHRVERTEEALYFFVRERDVMTGAGTTPSLTGAGDNASVRSGVTASASASGANHRDSAAHRRSTPASRHGLSRRPFVDYPSSSRTSGMTSRAKRSISRRCGENCSSRMSTPAAENSAIRSATCLGVPMSSGRSPRLETE